MARCRAPLTTWIGIRRHSADFAVRSGAYKSPSRQTPTPPQFPLGIIPALLSTQISDPPFKPHPSAAPTPSSDTKRSIASCRQRSVFKTKYGLRWQHPPPRRDGGSSWKKLWLRILRKRPNHRSSELAQQQ